MPPGDITFSLLRSSTTPKNAQDEVLLRHLSLACRLCGCIRPCTFLPKPWNCESCSCAKLNDNEIALQIARSLGGNPTSDPILCCRRHRPSISKTLDQMRFDSKTIRVALPKKRQRIYTHVSGGIRSDGTCTCFLIATTDRYCLFYSCASLNALLMRGGKEGH